MIYLLDTHTFLWFIGGDASLSPTAKILIQDLNNTILLSMASVWEMAIKVSLGKLSIPPSFEQFIDNQLQLNSVIQLDIKTSHTAIITTLPFHHRDPFDRLIIAQALYENIPIIGADSIFDAYGVTRLW
jgi:PIN domain nuclease of toxin-antitoxin system